MVKQFRAAPGPRTVIRGPPPSTLPPQAVGQGHPEGLQANTAVGPDFTSLHDPWTLSCSTWRDPETLGPLCTQHPSHHSCYACPTLPCHGHTLALPSRAIPQGQACVTQPQGNGLFPQQQGVGGWGDRPELRGWGPSLKPKLVRGPPGPMARDKTVAKKHLMI